MSQEETSKREKENATKQISFGELTEKNVKQLKILNAGIFPVRYNDTFYTDLLKTPENTYLAYQTDVLVGAVCCRLEMMKPKEEVKEEKTAKANQVQPLKLYIMTLGVLAPYRKLGIGRQLLEFVFKLCKERPNVKEIYLHVQTNNEDGINFYKHFGFEVGEKIENYYKRIEPPDCYVLSKKL